MVRAKVSQAKSINKDIPNDNKTKIVKATTRKIAKLKKMKKIRNYRPGTAALRDIRRHKKSTELMRGFLREIADQLMFNLRF